MVRRLVHQQEVARLHQQPRERDAGLLATGEHLHRLVDVVTAEHEPAEDLPHARRRRIRGRPQHHLIDGQREVERVGVVLRVVAERHAVAELDRAAVVRQLARHHAEQRGLAGAVHPDDADLLAALDRQVDAGEHDVIAVRLLQPLDPDHVRDRAIRRREREPHRAALHVRLDLLHLLEELHARLHGLGLVRLRAEPVDEVCEPLALAGEVLRLALEDGLLLGALLEVLLVVPRIAAHALVLEAHDARDLLVQEVAVVGDQDEAAGPLLQEVRKPRDRRHVEVVGRLVEQQHVGALEQEAREDAAHLPAAGELADVAVLVAR